MANATQYILPPVFAAVGFVFGGTQGAQIGWMIGSYAGSALMKRSGDANITEMPGINSASRGQLIYLTFGANRVASLIGWTKNYTPVLHNSGGKGGGSGAPGGAAGQQPYYTYNWDVMFVFGMVDRPSFIRNAWVSGKRITLVTTEQWASTLPLSISNIFPFLTLSQQSKQKESVTLTASETFFAPGYPTGDADLEVWTYFQTQEGVDCKFPHISWLGFKQLDLGPAPHLPQLTVELVPLGDATLVAGNDGWIDTLNVFTEYGAAGFGSMPSDDMMAMGADGKHYVIIHSDGFRLYCIEDHTSTLITQALAAAAITSISHDFSSAILQTAFVVPGKAQVIIGMSDPGAGAFYYVGFANMQIDETGTLVPYRYVVGRTSGLSNGLFNAGPYGVTWFRDIENYDQIVYAIFGTTLGLSSNHTCIFQFPLNEFYDDVTPGAWEAGHVHTMDPLGTTFFDNNIGADKRIQNFRGTVVLQDGVPSVLAYISQSMVDSANTGNTIIEACTEPQFILCNGNEYFNLTIGTAEDDWIDLPDIMTKYDDTVSTSYYDDWASPNIVSAGGNFFLVFSRGFSTNAEYQRLRVYFWNDLATAGVAFPIQVATATGRTVDMVVEGGVTEPDRTIYYPEAVQAQYNPVTGKMWTMALHSKAGIAPRAIFAEFGDFTPVSGEEDVTPAYIIYKALTSEVYGAQASALFGFNINTDRIDQDSYNAAVSYCVSQGIKVATTFTNYDNLLSILDSTLNLYAGFLIDIAGKVYFGFAQDTDDTGITVDNRHLIGSGGKPPVRIKEPAVQDTFNQVSYSYIDRALDYRTNQVALSDEVDMDFNGPRMLTYPPRWVMAGSLAQMEAERTLWTNLYGRKLYEFKLGWNRCMLAQGDVFTLVDSFDTALSAGKKVRLIRRVENKRGQWDCVAAEFIPYYLNTERSYTDINSMNITNYVSTPAPVIARMYEMPKEVQTKGPRVYVGYNQLSQVMGAQLYLSADGDTFNLADNIIPFCTSGIFPAAMPYREPGYMEENIDLYLMPTSPFDVNTPTFCQTVDVDNPSQGVRAVGSAMLVVGSEAIAFEGVTLLSQNHVRIRRMFRGWAGTPINSVSSGALWHWHTNGIFEHAINENDIGTILHYKVVPYNFANELYNIASVDARTYEIRGLYWLPRAQSPVELWVDTPVSWTRSAAVIGAQLAVESGGCNVQLTWHPAAQADGYGAFGYGTSTYGHFVADILTPAYRVDVYSVNGLAVSSFVANTGYFSYTREQNSADFNGFGKDVMFKVTPYNTKGDGPTSTVRSLSLFY